MGRPNRDRAAKHLKIDREQYIRLSLDTLVRACLRKVEAEKDKMRFIDFVRRSVRLRRLQGVEKAPLREREGWSLSMAQARGLVPRPRGQPHAAAAAVLPAARAGLHHLRPRHEQAGHPAGGRHVLGLVSGRVWAARRGGWMRGGHVTMRLALRAASTTR